MCGPVGAQMGPGEQAWRRVFSRLGDVLLWLVVFGPLTLFGLGLLTGVGDFVLWGWRMDRVEAYWQRETRRAIASRETVDHFASRVSWRTKPANLIEPDRDGWFVLSELDHLDGLLVKDAGCVVLLKVDSRRRIISAKVEMRGLNL